MHNMKKNTNDVENNSKNNKTEKADEIQSETLKDQIKTEDINTTTNLKEIIIISPGICCKTLEMNLSHKKDLIYEILKIISLFIIIIILIFCVLLFGKKLFSNYCFNDNHIEVIMESKEPTSSVTGLTEGKKCSRCGKILIEQKELPKKYKIKYMWNNICLSEDVISLNYDTIYPEKMYTPLIDGYVFKGWYKSTEYLAGDKVDYIPSNLDYNLCLFAKMEEVK